jgi:DNA-binding LytR/AlgR family response regulator
VVHSVDKAYFFVKSGKVFKKILLEDIQYFEGEKEYVRLVTSTEQILIYRRLKDIEDQLELPFIRVHNSYIVNTKQLNKIQDNHIFIAAKQIPISEKFKDRFMAVIQQRIF